MREGDKTRGRQTKIQKRADKTRGESETKGKSKDNNA